MKRPDVRDEPCALRRRDRATPGATSGGSVRGWNWVSPCAGYGAPLGLRHADRGRRASFPSLRETGRTGWTRRHNMCLLGGRSASPIRNARRNVGRRRARRRQADGALLREKSVSDGDQADPCSGPERVTTGYAQRNPLWTVVCHSGRRYCAEISASPLSRSGSVAGMTMPHSKSAAVGQPGRRAYPDCPGRERRTLRFTPRATSTVLRVQPGEIDHEIVTEPSVLLLLTVTKIAVQKWS